MNDMLDKHFFKLILISFCLLPWAFSSTCTLEGCYKCLDSTTCSDCSLGYYKKDGRTCTKITCIDNCDKCSSTQSCNTCISGFKLYNSKCLRYTCSVQNCESCLDYDIKENVNTHDLVSNICGVCKKGYDGIYCAPIKVFECDPYPNCLSCSNNSGCTSCKPNYTMSNKGECLVSKCVAVNCEKCDPWKADLCQVCKSGYAKVNGECVATECWDPLCKKCQKYDKYTCEECQPGYYYDLTIKLCSKITNPSCQVENCNTCFSNDPNTCTSCSSGYSLKNGKCGICNVANCSTCSDANFYECKVCRDGYELRDGKCGKCLAENCDRCSETSFNTCGKCKAGFELKDGFCGNCFPSRNCLTCSGNFVTCTSCSNNNNNFYLSNGNCNTCPSGCKACEVTNSTLKCLECSDSSASKDSCMKCDLPYCETCEAADYTKCKKCKEGFGLIDGRCSVCYDYNCKECEDNNLQKCNRCKEGYILTKDNKCINCGNMCQECYDTKCLKCLDGYKLSSSNLCTSCSYGCNECEIFNNNMEICKKCNTNFILVDQKCQSCGGSCKVCENITTCKECYGESVLWVGQCYSTYRVGLYIGAILGPILYLTICIVGICCLARKCRNDMEKAKLLKIKDRKNESKEAFEEFYGEKISEIELLIKRTIDKEKLIFVEETTKVNKETTTNLIQTEAINPDANTSKIKVFDKDLLIEEKQNKTEKEAAEKNETE